MPDEDKPAQPDPDADFGIDPVDEEDGDDSTLAERYGE